MIGRLAADWLDPYFVREEELAAIISRRSNQLKPQRRNINLGNLPTGNVAAIVPQGFDWMIYSITILEPTDAGVGALPKEYYVSIEDESGNIVFSIPADTLPATTAQSYITWGLGLHPQTEDDSQLPPSYKITAPLPSVAMKEGYEISIYRDGVGGVPVTQGLVRIFYLEIKVE